MLEAVADATKEPAADGETEVADEEKSAEKVEEKPEAKKAEEEEAPDAKKAEEVEAS